MKIKQVNKPSPISPVTQSTLSRTKSVRKCPLGTHEKSGESILLPDIQPELKLSLEFGEAMLATAILLSDRLHQLNGDASTRVIQQTLKLAQANFDALRARVGIGREGVL